MKLKYLWSSLMFISLIGLLTNCSEDVNPISIKSSSSKKGNSSEGNVDTEKSSSSKKSSAKSSSSSEESTNVSSEESSSSDDTGISSETGSSAKSSSKLSSSAKSSSSVSGSSTKISSSSKTSSSSGTSSAKSSSSGTSSSKTVSSSSKSYPFPSPPESIDPDTVFTITLPTAGYIFSPNSTDTIGMSGTKASPGYVLWQKNFSGSKQINTQIFNPSTKDNYPLKVANLDDEGKISEVIYYKGKTPYHSYQYAADGTFLEFLRDTTTGAPTDQWNFSNYPSDVIAYMAFENGAVKYTCYPTDKACPPTK